MREFEQDNTLRRRKVIQTIPQTILAQPLSAYYFRSGLIWTYLSKRIRKCRLKWSSYRFSVSSNLANRVASYGRASAGAPGAPADRSGSAEDMLRAREAAVQEANIVQHVINLEWIYIQLVSNRSPPGYKGQGVPLKA